MLSIMLLAAALTDAPTILARMGEQDAHTKQVRFERGFTCVRRETKSDVSGTPPKLTPKEKKEFRMWADADGIRQQLVMKDGTPVRDGEVEQPNVDLIGALRTRYHVTLVGTAVIDGAESWVLNFTPINPDAPAANSQEAVLNHMAGTAWVDAAEYFVRRIEARVPAPFRQDIVGKLRTATIILEQDLVDGVPAPRREESSYSYSVGFWNNTNQNVVIEYLDRQFSRPAVPPTGQTPLP